MKAWNMRALGDKKYEEYIEGAFDFCICLDIHPTEKGSNFYSINGDYHEVKTIYEYVIHNNMFVYTIDRETRNILNLIRNGTTMKNAIIIEANKQFGDGFVYTESNVDNYLKQLELYGLISLNCEIGVSA